MKDYKRENPVVGAYSNTPLNESLFFQMICFRKYPVNRTHTSLMFFLMKSSQCIEKAMWKCKTEDNSKNNGTRYD